MRRKSDQRSPERAIGALAARNYGVVTYAQLVRSGVSPGAVQRRVAAGRLLRVHRGVYSAVATLLSRRGIWLAAVWPCGDGALLSHVSAAALWGLREDRGATPHVSVPRGSGARSKAGVIVHRASLRPAEGSIRDRVPATAPARTVLDLVPELSSREVERMIDEAEYLRLLDESGLREIVRRRRGRPGAPRLAELIERHEAGSTRTRSELEEMFLALCEREGIRRPEVNQRIAGFEVDFLWRAERLVVETDGRRGHAGDRRFDRDRDRDLRLGLADHRVERVGYRQVVDDPTAVAALIRRRLRLPPAPRSRA